MKTEYTAIVERDRGWYVAHCIEIPGATGQGPTLEAAKESLAEAISLVLQSHEGAVERSSEEDTEEKTFH